MEIERKFLLSGRAPDLDRYQHFTVSQGYLISAGQDLEVRLRVRDGRRWLTIKQGGGLSRDEYEVEVERARFDRLWMLTLGRRIEKERYLIPAEQGLTIELDVYRGELEGLLTAEVEFDSAAQAERFAPPAWFGQEITGQARFSNQRLAERQLRSAADDPPFSLYAGEPISEGLQRVVRAQIDLASGRLEEQAGPDSRDGIHEARKSLKRMRATLKLARHDLPLELYEREMGRFRDAGRRLAGARDCEVLLQTFDGLCERLEPDAPRSLFTGFRQMLESDLRAAQEGLGPSADRTEAVLEDLRVARCLLPEWRCQHGDAAHLSSGLERIFHQGRHALRAAAADPTDERLHEVRKRTHELWHAAELLGAVAPKKMRKLARRAHHLCELVGDDHDLALMGARVRQQNKLLGDAEDLARLETVIDCRRAELQRRARRIGARVFDSSAARLL